MQSRHPINVIWNRASLDLVLEGQFIREVLLGNLGRPVRFMCFEAGANLPIADDLLVVSFNVQHKQYLRELRLRGARNIGLLHMADELCRHDRTFYADADYVLRNYYFKQALTKPSDQSL